MNIIKSAALYIRVSTHEQEELSPDAQKRLLLDYCCKNELRVSPEHIFIENGISGRKADKRPEFIRMIGMAKSENHPFDLIIVWKYSRFARNQEESILYKSMLKKINVDVISLSEPIMEGPFGSLIERIIEWMDEYYSIRLSGEVTRGMTEKALRGGYNGGIPYGYHKLKEQPLPIIYEPEARIVRFIYSEVESGLSISELSKKLTIANIKTRRGNFFETRAIRYILENPFYCGYIRWNRQNKRTHSLNDRSEWIVTKGYHEAIINKELFDRINSI